MIGIRELISSGVDSATDVYNTAFHDERIKSGERREFPFPCRYFPI